MKTEYVWERSSQTPEHGPFDSKESALIDIQQRLFPSDTAFIYCVSGRRAAREFVMVAHGTRRHADA